MSATRLQPQMHAQQAQQVARIFSSVLIAGASLAAAPLTGGGSLFGVGMENVFGITGE